MGCDGWLNTTLGDVTIWSSGGTPSKSNPLFWNGSIPWISAKSLKNGWIDSSDLTITDNGLKSGSNLAPEQTVLILVRGSGLFNHRYIGIVKKPVAFNQDIKCLKVKANLNPLFLYYLLHGYDNEIVGMLESTGIGAGKLDTKRLQAMKIALPPIHKQRTIAATLSCLDDKIELNNKINANLEAQAQAIFKSWFVNFEPFQDGEFVDSELGRIPKGWKAGVLSELITIKYGKDYKRLDNGQIPVFGSGGIMRYVDTALYNNESVLIPRKGTLNNVLYINEPFWTIDTMFYTKMRKPHIAIFIYFLIRMQNLASMNTGSAVPSMTTDILNKLSTIIPPDPILEEFNQLVTPLFETVYQNRLQCHSLSAIRDTLLPKLMSGEIEV